MGRLDTLRNALTLHQPNRVAHAFFFSHPLDETGAPQALLLAVKEYVKRLPPSSVHVVFPSGTDSAKRRFADTGATLHQVSGSTSASRLHARLGIQPRDFVLMNTLAIPENYVSYLEARRPQEVGSIWIHETSPKYLEGSLATTVATLAAAGRLRLLAPGKDGARIVEGRFRAPVRVAYPFLRGDIPDTHRTPTDYGALHIGFVGEYATGRKGQLLALLGLARAIESTPVDAQRAVKVTLFAVGEDRPGTFHVASLRQVCSHYLGERFAILPPLDRQHFLGRHADTNVTVCSSWSESFPLFVVEGMQNANVLIRNLVAGSSEQLANRRNGIAVPENTIAAYRDAFAEIIDRRLHSDEALADMGNESRRMVDALPVTNYWNEFGGERWFAAVS